MLYQMHILFAVDIILALCLTCCSAILLCQKLRCYLHCLVGCRPVSFHLFTQYIAIGELDCMCFPCALCFVFIIFQAKKNEQASRNHTAMHLIMWLKAKRLPSLSPGNNIYQWKFFSAITFVSSCFLSVPARAPLSTGVVRPLFEWILIIKQSDSLS